MFKLSLALTILSLIIGFWGQGGNIQVIFQPFEILLILGIATGTFFLSNPKYLIQAVKANIHKITKRAPYNKEDYLELLCFLSVFLKYAKHSSKIQLESHIETPMSSYIFKRYPNLLNNKHMLTFFIDYVRLITMEYDDYYEFQRMMEEEIFEKKIYNQNISGCLYRLGDSLPGIGILAAVLGIIIAMASIASEPAVLGSKIAASLIGTFLGIFLAYGIISPIAAFLEIYLDEELKFLECVKAALVSHVKGNSTVISIECARQIISEQLKPSFVEVESRLKSII